MEISEEKTLRKPPQQTLQQKPSQDPIKKDVANPEIQNNLKEQLESTTQKVDNQKDGETTKINLLDNTAVQTRKLDTKKVSNSTVPEREKETHNLGELDPFYKPVPDKDIKVESKDLETLFRGAISNNGFLFSGGSAENDEAAAILIKEVIGGLIGTGLSSALIATGVLAPLGIILLLLTMTPDSVKDSLKKWATDNTFNVVDFSKLPKPSEIFTDYIKNSKDIVKKKEESIKNNVNILAQKNDLYNLCNSIRDFGRVLSEDEVKKAVEAFKDLAQKATNREIKDKDLPAKFKETFTNLKLDFGSKTAEISPLLEKTCLFLKNNVVNNVAVFSTDLNKVLESFESLLKKEKTTEPVNPTKTNSVEQTKTLIKKTSESKTETELKRKRVSFAATK